MQTYLLTRRDTYYCCNNITVATTLLHNVYQILEALILLVGKTIIILLAETWFIYLEISGGKTYFYLKKLLLHNSGNEPWL